MKKALIIGGGVVGLAIATELTDFVDELYVVEKEKRFGEHASSRSSEVIHSGIYYKPGSLKARLCWEGNHLLQKFCEQNSVPYKMCGKIIVAKDSKEEETLFLLLRRAEENGVVGVKWMESQGIKLLEPNVCGFSALHVPSSGIFDTADYTHTLEKIAADNGVSLVTNTQVIRIERKNAAFAVTTLVNGEEQEPIFVNVIINAAGVHADEIAKMVHPENNWQTFPVKGEAMYFRQSRRELETCRHVYPAPVTYTLPNGEKGHTAGVHTSWRLDGRVTLGPFYDEHPKNKEDYVLARSAKEYVEKINRVFPHLKESDLRSHQAGIQPKLSGGDFVLEPDKSYENAYHCIGIDSPGLTASLAIAKKVKDYFVGKKI